MSETWKRNIMLLLGLNEAQFKEWYGYLYEQVQYPEELSRHLKQVTKQISMRLDILQEEIANWIKGRA